MFIAAYEIEGGAVTIPTNTPPCYIFTKITKGDLFDSDALYACRGAIMKGYPELRFIKTETSNKDIDYPLLRLSLPG